MEPIRLLDLTNEIQNPFFDNYLIRIDSCIRLVADIVSILTSLFTNDIRIVVCHFTGSFYYGSRAHSWRISWVFGE